MRRKWLSVWLVWLVFLAGCGSVKTRGDNGEAAVSDNGGHTFIFVCSLPEHEYWTTCIEGMLEASAELGITTKITGPENAENFATEILDCMRETIAAEPDGIIVYAGVDGMTPLINEAVQKGIPVLAIDSDAPDSLRAAYVGTDAYNTGYKAGEIFAGYTGSGAKIGVMISSQSAEKEMQVVEAFYDAVFDYDTEVVKVIETDGRIDVAEEETRKFLEEYPDVSALFCTCDVNVSGAARVKKELGRDDLVLVGFDDIEENLKFVREGVINSILVQNIRQAGYQSIYLLHEYMENGSLAQESYDVGTIVVTKDNVDTYAGSGSGIESYNNPIRVGYYTGDTAFQDGFDDTARKSGYAYEYYQTIAALTGWRYEYVYGTRYDVMRMLASGDLDIVAGVYRTDELMSQMLFSEDDMGLEGEKRYFAVNKDRPDILSDLNYAMGEIIQYQPKYQLNLRQKYYSQTTQQPLTENEKQWLSEKDVLRIGYIRYNLPLSEQDENGNPTGLIKDLLGWLETDVKISVEAVCYENIAMLEEGLKNGEIDAAFPIYSDLWLNEQKGFRQTDAFVNDRVMIVYQGDYTNDLFDRVAISETGIGQRYYLAEYYPDTTEVFYKTRKETLDAVVSGKEKCSIACASVLQLFIAEHSEYTDLNIAYLDTTENFGMAVRQEDSILNGILNKTIRRIDNTQFTSAMIRYTSVERSITLKDVLQQYSVSVITVLSVFVIALLVLFVMYRRRVHFFNQKQEESRMALEEALNDARMANEAKTTFLSSMSHDIRTPMNAIIGMTAIASSHLDDRERTADCLEKINVSSNHLLTLINNVLDISKIESGKATLNPVNFSLNDSVKTLTNIAETVALEKQIKFSLRTHNITHEMLFADEVRINQIFINILTNAVKYTKDKGKVTVDLTEEYSEGSDTVRVIYVVEDTGIGMSEEFMATMYDTFSRAKDSRVDEIQGTGLGLAIVKQMIDMMNGTIECESKEGVGTKFTVVLDLPVEKNKSAIVKKVEEFNREIILDGLRLLVAEDNDLNWEVINELLKMRGMSAVRAENGQKCIDILEGSAPNTFDLILMDIQMPVLNGLEATKEIRKAEQDYVRSIPIIAMTADAFSEDVNLCIQAGMNGHASKPVDMAELCNEIKKVLFDKK